MVQKLGGGGFGTVYMVQVTLSSYLLKGIRSLAFVEIVCQRKTNKELFAAKHQKHTRPEDLAYARNELEILTKVTLKKDQLTSSKVQMKECRAILDLEEYFESGLQSVILTEYLEVRRRQK